MFNYVGLERVVHNKPLMTTNGREARRKMPYSRCYLRSIGNQCFLLIRYTRFVKSVQDPFPIAGQR